MDWRQVNWRRFRIAGAPNTVASAGNAAYAHIPQTVNNLSPISKFDAVTGAIDPNFVTDFRVINDPVRALISLGSALYIAGGPSVGGSGPALSPVKVDAASGTVDATFTQANVVDSTVHVFASTGNDLYMGGDFTRYRGARGYYFIPINPTTGAPSDPP